MSNPLKIFLGIACVIMIAAAGLAAGYYFQQGGGELEIPAPPKITSAPKPASSSPDAGIENKTTYDASPPSRGAAIKRFPIELKPENNKAIVKIPSDTPGANEIKTGQFVLLYKADGSLLEILGEIINVGDIDKDLVIDINLNGDNAVSSGDAVRGDIILYSTKEAQRLPVTSIVTDDGGQPYVWEVLGGQNNPVNTARYQPANILIRTYDYVVIEQPDSISNVYILNPDSNLRDGQIINVRKMLFSAPFKTEEDIVSEAIAYRAPREVGKDPYEGKARGTCGYTNGTAQQGAAQSGAGCGQQQAGAPACGGGGTSCGAQRDVVMEFIQKIRASGTAGQPSP